VNTPNNNYLDASTRKLITELVNALVMATLAKKEDDVLTPDRRAGKVAFLRHELEALKDKQKNLPLSSQDEWRELSFKVRAKEREIQGVVLHGDNYRA
jgi:myo-inositol catabolism protein IolC